MSKIRERVCDRDTVGDGIHRNIRGQYPEGWSGGGQHMERSAVSVHQRGTTDHLSFLFGERRGEEWSEVERRGEESGVVQRDTSLDSLLSAAGLDGKTRKSISECLLQTRRSKTFSLRYVHASISLRIELNPT